MSGKFAFDDLLAFFGLLSLLAGVYLWFGLPPMLILLGIILIFIGWRFPAKVITHEPN